MNLDRVELTVWCREQEGLADDFGRYLAEQLSAAGGVAEPQLVREWLTARAQAREESASNAPSTSAGQPNGWLRVARCNCAHETRQLLHGYTESGRLWKGHVCMCGGFQCCECGRILERVSECCR